MATTREQLLLQTQKLASRRSEKPPKLPPRDNIYHPHDIPKPDYDDINEDDRFKAFRVKSDKGRDLNKKYGKLIQRSHQNVKNSQGINMKRTEFIQNSICIIVMTTSFSCIVKSMFQMKELEIMVLHTVLPKNKYIKDQ